METSLAQLLHENVEKNTYADKRQAGYKRTEARQKNFERTRKAELQEQINGYRTRFGEEPPRISIPEDSLIVLEQVFHKQKKNMGRARTAMLRMINTWSTEKEGFNTKNFSHQLHEGALRIENSGPISDDSGPTEAQVAELQETIDNRNDTIEVLRSNLNELEQRDRGRRVAETNAAPSVSAGPMDLRFTQDWGQIPGSIINQSAVEPAMGGTATGRIHTRAPRTATEIRDARNERGAPDLVATPVEVPTWNTDLGLMRGQLLNDLPNDQRDNAATLIRNHPDATPTEINGSFPLMTIIQIIAIRQSMIAAGVMDNPNETHTVAPPIAPPIAHLPHGEEVVYGHNITLEDNDDEPEDEDTF